MVIRMMIMMMMMILTHNQKQGTVVWCLLLEIHLVFEAAVVASWFSTLFSSKCHQNIVVFNIVITEMSSKYRGFQYCYHRNVIKISWHIKVFNIIISEVFNIIGIVNIITLTTINHKFVAKGDKLYNGPVSICSKNQNFEIFRAELNLSTLKKLLK